MTLSDGRPKFPTAIGRPVPEKMNKTEQRYADRLQLRSDVAGFWFEQITLRLGPDCRYTPDFMVLLQDGTVEFHEVKGTHYRDDAKAKFQTAAGMFPFVFRWCVWDKTHWTLTAPHEADR